MSLHRCATQDAACHRARLRMEKLILLGAAIFWLGNWSMPGFAGTSGLSLTKCNNPRSAGMGHAYIAVSDDAYAIFANPAGLSYLAQSQLAAAYGTGLMDDTLSQVVYAHAGDSCNTWAVALRNYDLGCFEFVDFNGKSTPLRAQSDWLLDVGYACRLGNPFRLGLTLKAMHSEVLERWHATTAAMDLGVTINPSAGFRMDIATRNMGFPLSYSADSGDKSGLPLKNGTIRESLPVCLEMGVAVKPLRSTLAAPGHDLALAVSAMAELEKPVAYHAGLEYQLYKIFALRAGYSFGDKSNSWATYAAGEDLEGLSVGAGVRCPVFANLPMNLDYSLQFSRALNYQHKAAITLGFCGHPERAEGAQVLTNTYQATGHKFSFGFGGSYAGPGFYNEIMPNNYIGLFLGLGEPAPLGHGYRIGAAAGARFYFGSPTAGVRGRFSGYATAISTSDPNVPGGVVAVFSHTLGLEWRFTERMSLCLDGGAGVGSMGAVPMGDIGFVLHMPRKPEPQKPPQQEPAVAKADPRQAEALYRLGIYDESERRLEKALAKFEEAKQVSGSGQYDGDIARVKARIPQQQKAQPEATPSEVRGDPQLLLWMSDPGLRVARQGTLHQFNWSALPGAAGYHVYATKDPAADYQQVNRNVLRKPQLRALALPKGKYRVQVAAMDENGNEIVRSDDKTLAMP